MTDDNDVVIVRQAPRWAWAIIDDLLASSQHYDNDIQYAYHALIQASERADLESLSRDDTWVVIDETTVDFNPEVYVCKGCGADLRTAPHDKDCMNAPYVDVSHE